MVKYAQKKTPKSDLQNTLAARRKEIEDNTVKFEWAVTEFTPGHYGAYDERYGRSEWIPPKEVIVSDFFPSEEYAQEWMDQHEPDEGKELLIRKYRVVAVTKYVRYPA